MKEFEFKESGEIKSNVDINLAKIGALGTEYEKLYGHLKKFMKEKWLKHLENAYFSALLS